MRFTKKDKVHYIIYKQLDILKLPAAYKLATFIVEALKEKKLV